MTQYVSNIPNLQMPSNIKNVGGGAKIKTLQQESSLKEQASERTSRQTEEYLNRPRNAFVEPENPDYYRSQGVLDSQAVQIEKKKVLAFVGGAGDSSMHGTVKNIAAEQGGIYFTWDQGKKLAAWIDENKNNSIRLIGHSYGGDTAATVVSKGHKVDVLVTVDPVSHFRPDFEKVAANSGKWINYDSVSKDITWNNTVGAIGGDWDSAPKKYADEHIESDLGHVRICLNYCY
ncbi:hypothetical protein L4D15_12020 [Enterovibrio norvegicus]|uniref:hypothetical protein n=1 Tax=Enterovibrio norvegicus TaxID=188144 RepID=UPI003D103B1C